MSGRARGLVWTNRQGVCVEQGEKHGARYGAAKGGERESVCAHTHTGGRVWGWVQRQHESTQNWVWGVAQGKELDAAQKRENSGHSYLGIILVAPWIHQLLRERIKYILTLPTMFLTNAVTMAILMKPI